MRYWIGSVLLCLALAGCKGASAPPGFIGPWTDGATKIWLNRDGTYAVSPPNGSPAQGTWTEAHGILTREAGSERRQDRWEARENGWTLILTPVSPPGPPVNYHRR
jgi:hypothetical protein